MTQSVRAESDGDESVGSNTPNSRPMCTEGAEAVDDDGGWGKALRFFLSCCWLGRFAFLLWDLTLCVIALLMQRNVTQWLRYRGELRLNRISESFAPASWLICAFDSLFVKSPNIAEDCCNVCFNVVHYMTSSLKNLCNFPTSFQDVMSDWQALLADPRMLIGEALIKVVPHSLMDQATPRCNWNEPQVPSFSYRILTLTQMKRALEFPRLRI